MNARRGWRTATVLLALLAPGVARADGVEGRFSIAFQVGTQSELAGDFLKGAAGTLLGKPVSIDSKRYRDIFAPGLRLQGQLGFGIGERTEVIARFTHYRADGTSLEVGTFNDYVLNMYFDEYSRYQEVGFEAGLRFYISAAGRFKSYVAPVVGARFVDEILVSFSAPEAGSSILNVPFNREGTVPVFGLDLGFTFDLGEHLFVGLDSALRYQTAPKQFDELEGLTGIDDSDGRWSAPVCVSIGMRF